MVLGMPRNVYRAGRKSSYASAWARPNLLAIALNPPFHFTKCGLGSSLRAIGLLPGSFRGALPSLRALRETKSKGPDERRPRIVTLKVISWNLLRLTGAGVQDVAALIEQHRPDLLLLQEATEQLSVLPARVGGCFFANR